MKPVVAGILCVGFAVLSFGHKFRWAQDDGIIGNKLGSVIYELAAVISALVAMFSTF